MLLPVAVMFMVGMVKVMVSSLRQAGHDLSTVSLP